jgi:hypothetical protein
MELDSGDGLMEGLRIISSDTPAGIRGGAGARVTLMHHLTMVIFLQTIYYIKVCFITPSMNNILWWSFSFENKLFHNIFVFDK